MKKIYSIIFLLFTLTITLSAQRIDEDRVRQELEERGVDEEEVRKRMLARGIDVDKIDPTNAVEVMKAERTLKQVMAELEEENQAAVLEATKELAEDAAAENATEAIGNEAQSLAKESAGNIQKAVDKGADIKEAISEELLENAQNKFPPAKIYGQQIFRNKEIKVFNQSKDIRPSDSYVLGAGDKVTVSIWGASQIERLYIISEEGYIQPQKMARINLKGISFGKARKLLEQRFSSRYQFNANEFEVTISFARTITVNIYGEVFNPGGFVLPATNTAFNALVAAGGPSDIGTVRNIKLVRAGEKPRSIDVYEFMSNPAVRDKFYLQDNDIIHVPTAKNIVSIEGAIKRPFQYELLPGEGLKQLIEYAGGLNANAYQTNVQVKRFVADEEKILDVNLRALTSGKDYELKAGDKVFISNIPRPYKNFAEIVGAIELPGKYEITPDMKVTSLLERGILKEGARKDVAYMQRRNADNSVKYIKIDINAALQNPAGASNITLAPQDKLIIYSQSQFVDAANITVRGAVRNPSEHPYDIDKGIRVSDAIILGGGLRVDATDFAYIHRNDPTNKKQKEYIRVNLKELMANPQSPTNFVLKPYDILEVYSNVTYTDEVYIRVSGAVRQPGEYRYDQSLKLKDVLTLAGGLKIQAAANRIDIFRVQIEDNEQTKTIAATITIDEDFMTAGNDFALQPFDQIMVRSVPDFEFQRNFIIRGEVKYPGQYALVDTNQKIYSTIQQVGGLSPEAFPEGATLYRAQDSVGYVVMNLAEVLENPRSKFNYIIKEGDIIEIPKKNELVSIIGATKASELYPDKIIKTGKINVAYYKGKSAKWYINKYAAGVGEQGSNKNITVEHLNGEIERTKNFVFFKVYPKVRKGSVIKVGKKALKTEKEKTPKKDIDWGEVIADSITQATAILTLILLVQRLD
ncbi:MAG: SLBB domain-containing protein [Saprospiraceae bacterium]